MAIDPAAAGLPDDLPASRHLRTRAFRTLLLGWTLTNVADSLLTLILAVWVTDLTGSAALGGATFVLLGLPALASPFLGALADRVSRLRMLITAYVLGAAGLSPLFLVREPDQVWLVYAATLLYGLIQYVTAACQAGLLRDLLPDAALGAANARLQTIDQVLRIVGPVVGAALYAAAGPLPVVGIAVAGFAGAAVVFWAVRITESVTPEREEHLVAHLLAGFRHLFDAQPLSGMMRVLMVAMGAIGLINAIAFAALAAMGLPASLLGPINAVQGIAGIAAGLTAPRLMERIGRTRVFAVGMTMLGIGLVPLVFLWLPAVIAGLALTGFGVVSVVISYMTEQQIATPDRLQGRTATASQVAMNLPMVATTAASAALIAIVDFRIMVAAGAALVLLVGALSFRLRERRDPDVGARG